MTTLSPTHPRLIASARTWIDPDAIRQLCDAAALEGVTLAVGLPNLQAGAGTPTGAVFVSRDVLHPRLLGHDLGCGFSLFSTSLESVDADPDRWADLRFDLEHPWEGDAPARLAREELCATQYVRSFGMLDGGQHFAELQVVEKVLLPGPFRRLGLARGKLALLVHAGSGDCGRELYENHLETAGPGATEAGSAAGTHYRLLHDHALRWARANRTVVAERFLGALHASGRRVLDACHHSLTPVPGAATESLWLHRCGAAPADGGPLVIAGSTGSLTHVVQPVSAGPAHGWSLAHGAGRRWTRRESRLRMRERFDPAQLAQTGLGGRVICEDRARLYEEAPPAYKDVETVIADLVEAGLIEVIATLRPLLTYKTRAVRR